MSILSKLNKNGDGNTFTPGKSLIRYVAFSAFLCVFAFVYELFGHGVYSNYMIYSFTVPLIYGFVQTVYCLIAGEKRYPPKIAVTLHSWSCVSVALFCVFKGALEIYGTDSDLLKVYIAAAIVIEIAEKLTLLLKRR